jgi:hypothetical protein
METSAMLVSLLSYKMKLSGFLPSRRSSEKLWRIKGHFALNGRSRDCTNSIFTARVAMVNAKSTLISMMHDHVARWAIVLMDLEDGQAILDRAKLNQIVRK